jgi:hypothetical protein
VWWAHVDVDPLLHMCAAVDSASSYRLLGTPKPQAALIKSKPSHPVLHSQAHADHHSHIPRSSTRRPIPHLYTCRAYEAQFAIGIWLVPVEILCYALSVGTYRPWTRAPCPAAPPQDLAPVRLFPCGAQARERHESLKGESAPLQGPNILP